MITERYYTIFLEKGDLQRKMGFSEVTCFKVDAKKKRSFRE